MTDKSQPVSIVDLNIPFWSLVWLMVKWALAAIPAMIILGIFVAGFMAVFGIVGGVGR
jgi:hypothetical protein